MQTQESLIEELICCEQNVEIQKKNWIHHFGDSDALMSYQNAYQDMLAAQRKLASYENVEYCEPLDFNHLWDRGAPMPHLLQNEHKAYLVYYSKPFDPPQLSKTIHVVNQLEDVEPITVVQFKQVWLSQFGAPNDEFLGKHRLYGKGLDYYMPFVVRNSSMINYLNVFYKSKSLDQLSHYIFPFHDSTFECVALSYEVEIIHDTMKAVMSYVNQQLFKTS